MDTNNIDHVRKISEIVYSCLANELKNFVNSCHQHFPFDCCDIASGLLFRVLRNEGYTGFNLIRGTDAEDFCHVWLENDNYVIDLTAHQFNNFKEPMILIKKDIYPLNKKPYFTLTEITDINDWCYFDILAVEFFDIFYCKYFIKNN
ncbi:hypothetical protein ACKENX_15300 [Acinetobacter baumannii]|uniref:hypothetical protein n=1 Tax=Acinetobacter baumannii TaxID=470 RepID=UPI0038B54B8F